MLTGTNVFSQDRTKFAFYVAKNLNSDASADCVYNFPELQNAFQNFSSSDILNNTGIIFFIYFIICNYSNFYFNLDLINSIPTEKIAELSEKDTLKLIENFNANTTLSPELASILAQNLGESIMNISFDKAKALINDVPIEYFDKVNVTTLANNIANINLEEMDENRKFYIANLVFV